MKALTFLVRLIGTTCAITAAGAFGVYFIGWRRPFPTSWVWSITSVIGGYIASSRYNVGIWKIIVACFAWPIVLLFIFGMGLGICIAVCESRSESNKIKSGI